MCQIFFIHPAISGHLFWLHVLVIVDSAEVNIEVHISFQIIFVLNCMPRSGIGGLNGSAIFNFLKKPQSSSPQCLYQFRIPPTV